MLRGSYTTKTNDPAKEELDLEDQGPRGKPKGRTKK